MPREHQGQAVEPTKSARLDQAAEHAWLGVPGWLVGCLRLGGRACQYRPASSLHPGWGGRTRLPPRELLSSSQAQLVSHPGATTQPAPTTERSGRLPSQGTSRPCRVPATSTTSGSSPPLPAVPTWATTHPHSGRTGGAPGCRRAPQAGRSRHPHLADIGGRVERRHYHRHLPSCNPSPGPGRVVTLREERGVRHMSCSQLVPRRATRTVEPAARRTTRPL